MSPVDFWKKNITDFQIDDDIKYTAMCLHSRVIYHLKYQDPASHIPCSDTNGIPIIKEVVLGGIECIPDTKYPCNPCRLNA
jgi:Niemann-Pick C1 protein